MADRPVQETANRPTSGDGADAPATKGPVLPPMPGDNGAAPTNGRARGRKAAKPATPPAAPPPAPPVAADDTAVRPGATRPVRANLSQGRPQQAPSAAAAPVAPATRPATRPAAPQRPATTGKAPTPPPAAQPQARQQRGVAPAPSTKTERSVAAAPHAPRRARLRLTRVDPWSIMKIAFLLSIAVGIVTVIAVMTVWAVLGAAGVWDSINSTVASVVGGEDGSNFNVTDYVGMSRVLGFTSLVAVADVILLTALATLAAFLYNMAAALLGGVEVTLAEDDA